MAIVQEYSNSVNVTERTLAAQRVTMPSKPNTFAVYPQERFTVGSHIITLMPGTPHLVRVDGGELKAFWSRMRADNYIAAQMQICEGWDAFFRGEDYDKTQSDHWQRGWNDACLCEYTWWESECIAATEQWQPEPFDADRQMAHEEYLDDQYHSRGQW